MIYIYESKLAEKENIDLNTNNLESKVKQLVEKNTNLQVYIYFFFVQFKILFTYNVLFIKIELEKKTSQSEALFAKINSLQNKELVCDHHMIC